MTNSKPKDLMRRWKRSLKNIYKEYNEVERRVRNATSNDPWPSTSTQMFQIACDAGDQFQYDSVLGMLLKRVQDYEQMMHVKKGLLLAEYLLRNAPARFVNDMKDRKHIFDHLTKYRYVVEGVDKAEDVRLKAGAILRLLENDHLLEEQRATAERTRGKFVGYANSSVLPVGDRYNNSSDPFASSSRIVQHPQASEDRSEMSRSSSEESDSSSESEVVVTKRSKPRQTKSKQTRKVSKRASKARKSSKTAAVEGDLFDMDIVTGKASGGAQAPGADNWLAEIARLDERPAVQAPVSKALFDDLPPEPIATDPFAPVPSTSAAMDVAPSMNTAGAMPPSVEQTSTALVVAPTDPLWGSELADVSQLCHPHDYEGQRMQRMKHQRQASRGAGGAATLQELAAQSSGPRLTHSMPAMGDGRLSHANPFEASMVPDNLKMAPAQSMLALPAPPAASSHALVPAHYYPNASHPQAAWSQPPQAFYPSW